MSGERQGQHSPYFNAITAPPQLSDGNPRQCDITADITLKASSSEEFYGLTRRVTSRPKGMNRNINTKPTDALGCSLSPWLETNKGDPNAAQEYASFTVQNNLTSTIIQLLNVLTLSVEDRCMVISTSPEYNSNDK
ncbi:hypothetical protein QFC19_006296 [Naganishia cerealis]|uniref:Uncharacterized protein n=1 Tax=Naganishia cerealis TaxID=610337 RepID=A0ACC2VGN4_9TREE|nr:hypothetical protein QFC19_006296 [Naganishia cerealis]